MRARSRLNSLSSAPANCLGDSLLYMRRRRGARATGATRWLARKRVRWAIMVAGSGDCSQLGRNWGRGVVRVGLTKASLRQLRSGELGGFDGFADARPGCPQAGRPHVTSCRRRLVELLLCARLEFRDDKERCHEAFAPCPSVSRTMVRITTWNVNGIRNPFGYQPWREKRTFDYMFDVLEADIVVMQELKIQRKDLGDDMVLVPGWDCYFSLPKHKKGGRVLSTKTCALLTCVPGYSGVAIYTRNAVCAPIRAEEGLLGVLCPPGSSTPYRDLPEDAAIGGYPTPSQVASLGIDPAALDAEGRCVVLEFPAFVIFGVYSPANSNGLRDDFRYGFLTALDTRIRNLNKMGKRVILTGDLNVTREEIDTAKAEESMRAEGITREDYMNAPNRRVFNQLLEHGRVPGARDEGREEPVLWDLCREMHPGREGMFTHWEQKINARPGNFGSRIDYVLCSIEMKDWFQDANIQEGLMGSDHCPVYASTKDIVEYNGEKVHMVDLMNAPGIFKSGVRLREYSPAQDLRSLSGRLLPEFDKRRSIKDMFSKARAPSKAPPLPLQASPDLRAASAGRSNPAVVPYAPNTANGSTADQKISLNAPEKRRVSDAPLASSAKKSKINAAAFSQTRSSSGKGQQSLRGFFAPKVSPAKPKPEDPSSQHALDEKPSHNAPAGSEEDRPPSSFPPPVTPPPVRDPEASKESWVKLFSKKPPPRCESHDEPCKSFTTKKPGVNCGRHFWTCSRRVPFLGCLHTSCCSTLTLSSRPLGPSGQKESGTQWRCGTFIWASDWNAPSPQK